VCSNKVSGREIALKNELSVLKVLHRFGWLRSKDIATLVWQAWDKRYSNKEPVFIKPVHTSSGLRMAQITLKRLIVNGLVLSSKAPDSATLYALSQKGVNRLNDVGIESASGKDLLRVFSIEQYRHRVISNEIAIVANLQGFKVFNERQIAQNKWLFNQEGFNSKKPDCLIYNQKSAWWIEVEKSRKNQRDYQVLLNWLNDVYKQHQRAYEKPILKASLYLEKIVFICNPIFEKRLIEDLIKKGWNEDQISLRLIFLTSLYSLRQITFM
jgi:hypothetical protein